MENILILCDSTCDLTPQQEEKFKIRIINCGVEIDGLPYKERVEIDSERIYDHVENGGSFPHHSQINVIDFVDAYMNAAKDGYTHIICVTMNDKGSGTHSAANHAIGLLTAEYPALEGKVTIKVIDSRTYSLGIANGVVQGIELLHKGKSFDEICQFLEEYFSHQMTFVGLHNLKYARMSGRLNATSAIVGDALGIKPVLLVNGTNEVFGKVRGEKNLIPKMADMYVENAADPVNGIYSIAYGHHLEYGKELLVQLKKRGVKATPFLCQQSGPCVSINAGPSLIGIVFRSK